LKTPGSARRHRQWLVTIGFLLAFAHAAWPASTETLQLAVDNAYESFKALDEGDNAQYIPALAEADPDAFGIVILTTDGRFIEHGDTRVPFAIMSAAKPFTLALLLEQQGPEVVLERIGVEPTGLPFNSLSGIDTSANEPLNPMVNAGAITAVSLLQVETPEDRWPMILHYYSQFAGEPLTLMGDVYKSVSRSNYRNRALVNLLQFDDRLGADPTSTLDVYNKQSSVAVTARQLAVMGATLANAGVNPLTGERVLTQNLVDKVLAMMMLSGFYDESGWWAYTAGLPAKSGVGGGIVAIVPGTMAIVGYSPRLSKAGNSVRGMKAIQAISAELGLSLFRPE
tara:strand:+ start:1384 stop:2403 length:1020 start_codon:yes stop_codon:yes gene_type:complete